MRTIKILEKTQKRHKIEKIKFFNKYKMSKISVEKYAKNCIHNIIDKEKMLWLREKNIGEKLSVENIYDLNEKEIKDRFETRYSTNEQIKEYKRHESELIDSEKFLYTLEDITMNMIMHCRVLAPEAIKFKTRLENNKHDLIMSTNENNESVCK